MKTTWQIWIEQHFGAVITFGILTGLLIPGLTQIPVVAVPIMLAFILYLACFKLSFDEFKQLSPLHFVWFLSLRFLGLPAVLYFIALYFLPAYAIAVLLFSLMPIATGAPGIISVLKGNVTQAFSLVLISTLLAPFIIPGAFSVLADTSLIVNTWALFQTLGLIVFMPMGAFFMTRQSPAIQNQVHRHSAWLTTLLLAAVAMIAIASSRELLFSSPYTVAMSFVILMVLLAIYYLFGWFVGRKCDAQEKN
ncbi:MAG: hypothetical protein AAF512_13395, partial [Pseudomonadota bacterium]